MATGKLLEVTRSPLVTFWKLLLLKGATGDINVRDGGNLVKRWPEKPESSSKPSDHELEHCTERRSRGKQVGHA